MKIQSQSLFAVALAFVAGILVACNLSSTADTTSSSGTTTDLSHLYIVLKAPNVGKAYAQAAMSRTPSTEAVQHSTVMQSPMATTSTGTAIAGCPGIGTLQTDDPTNGYYGIITCTGYYANIDAAPTSSDKGRWEGPLTHYIVFFTGPDCSGDAYINETGFTLQEVGQGFVFYMDTQGTGTNDTNNYWVIEAGESASGDLTMQSTFDGACSNQTAFSEHGMWQVKHNSDVVDSNGNPVSGLPSAPVPGPITVGTP